MPELPDVALYRASIERVAQGSRLDALDIRRPFLLRSVNPPPDDLIGRTLDEVRTIGKRIVLIFGDCAAVIHPMIAGRFTWHEADWQSKSRDVQMIARFDNGALILTEAGRKKRASLHIAETSALSQFDPGGIDPLTLTAKQIREFAQKENRTLKRFLTSPANFSGIGNAYSDEILFAARLSPMRLTSSLTDEEVMNLAKIIPATLIEWRDRLLQEHKERFPERKDVTAFRPDFATHGRRGEPCLVCGKPIQAIRYADKECNYCAKCQNEGRLLADRALSRLLKKDWPRTLEELENLRGVERPA